MDDKTLEQLKEENEVLREAAFRLGAQLVANRRYAPPEPRAITWSNAHNQWAQDWVDWAMALSRGDEE